MIRVLLVDGCAKQRALLRTVFEREPNFEVVGTARGADDALELIEACDPNIVTVGHQLPTSDGHAITSRIMETRAVPIVVVAASASAGEVAAGVDAVQAGALAVVQSPLGNGGADDAAAVRELLNTVRVMSEVKVVRRWAKPRDVAPARPTASRRAVSPIIGIGASTGGPLALATLLRVLPGDFGAPIVIVQHMATGFIRGFVDWLAPSSALPLHIAADGEYLQSGHVYIAPDARQLRVTRARSVALDAAAPENGLQPSVSYLFRSLADAYGADAIGVLLTGMGRDGASELKSMRDAGADTFAQDQASSIVHGMPGEAVRLGGALHVMPPQAIAEALVTLVAKKGAKP